ncbi:MULTISPECIES: hypothetical protein [unclassified Undibacterium]|uniref:hypothetical protein n=1 Tax=unclassified Undibacterium TaxID=2630295 RepID=UPI002AC93147|nr:MULTISPECIES: hypothetical protein [unclassified Undibacterium]MEB0138948.1 hypothetical protein [Undibacterium sp. CCC2.1]MEB0171721.1 hypothetical protein [Undibacterium sp. CCC1.1]MEB0175579.1 hypothetical protein [Undibacterium sp. CCC3.4]MEB0214923.1 hypothetical protein [Undibacterium sp. 5I2]WPX44907.1 hypothetical protein RHM61_06700 [Undibacterium sp. CCC3.4]
MSNIAGKAYAMNVITPIRWYTAWLNKLFFWVALKRPSTLLGLSTLSLIHYARWTIIGPRQFPHLSPQQPRENLRYAYMLFFSNFNGSWDQYVDSFTFAIPGGLDLFWKWNLRYSKSVALTPFHDYIQYNQLETIHYYNAYPLATSNDIKAAQNVKDKLIAFDHLAEQGSDEQFMQRYRGLLRGLQHDLGSMHPTPIISMSAYQVEKRERWHAEQKQHDTTANSLNKEHEHG